MRRKWFRNVVLFFCIIGMIAYGRYAIQRNHRMETGEERREVDEDTKEQLEFVSLQDAFDLQKLKENSYENLTIPSDLQSEPVEHLYDLQLSELNYLAEAEKKGKKFFKTILSQYSDGLTYQASNEGKYDGRYWPWGPEYEDGGFHAALADTGFLGFQKSAEVEECFSEGSCEKTFYLGQDEIDTSCELKNGRVSVSGAVEVIDGVRDELLELAGVQDIASIRAKRLLLEKGEDGERWLKAELQSMYEGVGMVDFFDTFSRAPEEMITRAEENLGDGEMYLFGPEQSDVAFFYLQNILVPVGEKRKISKLLPVSVAAELLSGALSAYRKYELQDVRLEYMLLKEKDRSALKEQYKAGELTKRQYKNFFLCRAKPVWRFYLDTTYNMEVEAYVDVRTGEVIYVSNQ